MKVAALDVEISLVNTNNRDLLERCLASLPDACEGLYWHVTVVDNASTDGSVEMVAERFPDAALIRNVGRLGFSANHNQVIRNVLDRNTARYALILNEDTELCPQSVTALVRAADADPAIGAIGPSLVGADGVPQITYRPFPVPLRDMFEPFLLRHRLVSKPGSGYLNGSCLLVRTQALREIGLLDERFFIFFEDTDLGCRLWQSGWSSTVHSGAVVVHHEHRTVSKESVNVAMERQMLRSRFLYVEKHRGRRMALLSAAGTRLALFVRAANAMLNARRSGDPEEAAQARLLADLARYDPRALLPHEERAGRAPE